MANRKLYDEETGEGWARVAGKWHYFQDGKVIDTGVKGAADRTKQWAVKKDTADRERIAQEKATIKKSKEELEAFNAEKIKNVYKTHRSPITETLTKLFKDTKEASIYKDDHFTKEETLVKDVLDKRIDLKDAVFYSEPLFGQEVDFTFNAENDISQYYNWRESVDPNSDTGQYLGDLSEHSTFKDNAAFNIIKSNGGENTHTKVTFESLYGQKVKGLKPDVNLGEREDPTKTIAEQSSDVKTSDVKPNLVQTLSPTLGVESEKDQWLADTADSPAARAGLDDELRWQAKQQHDKWKAERNQPETPDQTPKDQIEVTEPQSATQFIEGGLIDAQKDYMSRNYAQRR